MPKILYRFVDSFYAAYGFSKMYFYRKPPEKYVKDVKDGLNPIIILPGYLVRWAFMKNIADAVSSLGHSVYVVRELKNNTKNVADSAKIVSDFIEKNNLKNVVIVGRSKGGLIGKYILVHFNKENRVKGMIAIATPFYGSKLANYYKFIKSNEYYPQHPIIKELSEHQEVNNKIVTINPSDDNIVLSDKGTYLDGALENIDVKVAGHHKVVFDKEAINKVVFSIDKF